MRTVILSHSYQPCWTILNSPWLPAGQEPVSVQHWLQHRSPLTLQVSWLVEGFEEKGPLLQKKVFKLPIKNQSQCLVAAQVV